MISWGGEHLVDVEGGRLRVLRAGPSDARPAVLLLGGLGSSPSDWDRALDRLPPDVQLVWLEAIGLGGADPLRRRVDAIQTATRSLRLPPPYLLAGHSLGGLYAQGFARLAPNLTAGVALIDSSLPTSPARSDRISALVLDAALGSARRFFRDPRRAALVASMLRRLVVWSGTIEGSDPLSRTAARRIYGDPALALRILDEWACSSAAEAELGRLAADHPFPDVPLTVLAGARFGRPRTGRDTRWLRAQRRLALLAPHGRFVPLDDAAHLVMLDRPDAVAAVLDPHAELRQRPGR